MFYLNLQPRLPFTVSKRFNKSFSVWLGGRVNLTIINDVIRFCVQILFSRFLAGAWCVFILFYKNRVVILFILNLAFSLEKRFCCLNRCFSPK